MMVKFAMSCQRGGMEWQRPKSIEGAPGRKSSSQILKSRLLWACVTCVVSLCRAGGEKVPQVAASEPANLRILRTEYQQRVLKARLPADEWYRTQLRAQLPRYQKTGNWDVATLVQSEINDPDPERSLLADRSIPPELAGIRRSYVLQSERLTAPVRDWYRQQLQLLERALIQQGNLLGAQTVRAELEAVEMAVARPIRGRGVTASYRESPWSNPLGGEVKAGETHMMLKGPGRGHGQLEIAMSFHQGELSKEFKISARFKIEGNAAGFVLGRNETDCLTVYWSRGTSWAVQHTGPERRIVDRPALAWKPGAWQELELRRQGSDVLVKVDQSSILVPLPKGVSRWYFGVMTAYHPSTIEVRDLVVTDAREAIR